MNQAYSYYSPSNSFPCVCCYRYVSCVWRFSMVICRVCVTSSKRPVSLCPRSRPAATQPSWQHITATPAWSKSYWILFLVEKQISTIFTTYGTTPFILLLTCISTFSLNHRVYILQSFVSNSNTDDVIKLLGLSGHGFHGYLPAEMVF